MRDLTRKALLEAARNHIREKGQLPHYGSGTVTLPSGETTWNAIGCAFRAQCRGTDELGAHTLQEFLANEGVAVEITKARIAVAARLYTKKHHRAPTSSQEDAGRYLGVGYRISWCALNSGLSRGFYGEKETLTNLLVREGIIFRRGECPSRKEVECAARKFKSRRGKWPSQKLRGEDADAFDYFGRPMSWHRISALLTKEYGESIADFCQGLD